MPILTNASFHSIFVSSRYLNDSLVNKTNRVGSIYWKYVYKRYTNASFVTEIPNPPSFGYQGPLLRGEAGEILRVHFRNSLDINVTMHPHGVRYDKANEGNTLSRMLTICLARIKFVVTVYIFLLVILKATYHTDV